MSVSARAALCRNPQVGAAATGSSFNSALLLTISIQSRCGPDAFAAAEVEGRLFKSSYVFGVSKMLTHWQSRAKQCGRSTAGG